MRMIDKDALLSDIERTIEESGCVNHEGEIMDCVRYAPEVDAAPVVRGKWMPTDMGGGETDEAYVCSVCGEPWTLIDGTPRENNMHYCPNCGAKMESEGST